MLDDAARAVRRQYPDAVMSVGHLSKQGGGDLERHASHESGRDADIAFYIKSQTGRPLYSDHFVPFKGDGTAPSWPGAIFDDARNWALVAALLTDTHARVTYIFVANPIRARLLAYAERVGAPGATRTRAAEIMAQPRGSLPHDDHFHVRIGCPPDSRGCIELPTIARGKRSRSRSAGKVSESVAASSVRHAPTPTSSTPVSVPSPAEPSGESSDLRAPEATDGQFSPPPATWRTPIDDVDGLPLAPP
jgi:penicillin-insensitive murein endopeptidase